MKEQDILLEIKSKMPVKKYKHSIAVADTAEMIASKENFSIKKARQAALLHDYAKAMSITELRNIADLIIDEWNIDKEELLIPYVLHAPVSAYLAKTKLGISDMEVLEAIRFHTIGSPDMGKLAQIIFLADFIEPNRNFSEADTIRSQLEKGLEETIILICSYSIKYNIDLQRIVHPNTVRLRNAYLRRR